MNQSINRLTSQARVSRVFNFRPLRNTKTALFLLRLKNEKFLLIFENQKINYFFIVFVLKPASKNNIGIDNIIYQVTSTVHDKS